MDTQQLRITFLLRELDETLTAIDEECGQADVSDWVACVFHQAYSAYVESIRRRFRLKTKRG